ncbi:MAG: radical SAM family heme chaperone HemW [Fibrobacteres bacterium]|nr:radical SAM family heme chaperone HemW [Fibrobacterota bacterium]
MNNKNDTGIYIHVPFCVQKCAYCDFYSVEDLKLVEDYLTALEGEIQLAAEAYGKISVDTLYVGGGTPTILTEKHLSRILNALYNAFDMSCVAESTIECNPGTINTIKARELRKLSFNRVSIGIQSFCDNELKGLGRIHTSLDAVDALKMVKEAGFERINADFMFAIPGQTVESLIENLTSAIDLGVKHLSVYGLTAEKGTPFDGMVKRREIIMPREELYEASFLKTHDFLAEKGFLHYEISNYAVPGEESLHNLNCWRGRDYIGFGPAAHSRMGSVRMGNVRDIREYLINPYKKAFINEVDDSEKRMELFMLRLRTSEGITLQGMSESAKIHELVKKGLIETEGNTLRLTKTGMMLIDEIILILEEEECLILK